jgi:hypothetical protein
MARLTFYKDDSDNREAGTISFDELPADMSINEFKIICVRLAQAMGYSQSSIKRCFGDWEYRTDADKDFMNYLQTKLYLSGSLKL